MDASQFMEKLSKIIENIEIETHKNIIYHIVDTNMGRKTLLKRYITQGDREKDHTVVEIDFEKNPKKNGRSSRFKIKTLLKIDLCYRRFFRRTLVDSLGTEVEVYIYNSPIYIGGEYIKKSREMSQTPLSINGRPMTEKCVSDFIYDIQKYYDSGYIGFMANGREDIDVQCLEGRPFVLEIWTPCKNLQSREICLNLWREIQLVNVFSVKKEYKDIINKLEFNKIYILDLYTDKILNLQKEYMLEQKTPLRVLHRRSDILRKKYVKIIDYKVCCFSNGYGYEIKVEASPGTYIKEWVTGDFGRTTPNLSSDILRLDLVKVVTKNIIEKFILFPLKLNITVKNTRIPL